MRKLRFKTFFEATDIFGFDAKHTPPESGVEAMLERPINTFNIELMMEILSHKSLNGIGPHSNFLTEIQWGVEPGATKLEVDTGYTFYIKKLGIDKQGAPCWVAKKMFQLNRQGYGGMEDAVAHEIYEEIEKAYNSPQVAPQGEFGEKELENLVMHVMNKVKRTARNIFIYEGIRKVQDNVYLIKMGVRGHGVETPWHTRVEENLTQIHYDPKTGLINVTNFNIDSPTGGRHSWDIGMKDLDLHFFPNQERDEISECVAVHMKYY